TCSKGARTISSSTRAPRSTQLRWARGRRSWRAKVALDRFPRLAFVVAPLAWPTVSRLVRGEIDRPGQARGLARAPLGVLKRLAVQAGDRGAAFRSALPQS